MSKCISHHGEFSEHEMDETGFACLYCGFDDVEAMAARLTRALSLVHHLMRSRRWWQSMCEHIQTVEANTRSIADRNVTAYARVRAERQEARRWAAWFAAEKEHWLDRAAMTGQRLGRRVAELEASMWEASDWAAWFAAERDESRAHAGAAHGSALALQARVTELKAQVAARDARIAELEASQPFPAGYVTGFLNDQDRVCGLEHVAYPTRVQAVERAEYRRPSIPTVAVYALRKVEQ